MAVTLAQAEITERRLRPLYDAIDNGQNKKAIQMADKILKKQDDLHCAKALKAIALLRMGKPDESTPLIEEIMKARPGDQATLQAVTMFFRETGDNRKIVELYAAAAEHYPKNAEILTHLFMSYVRVGDYQKQQQTAAALHKAFPKNGPYYCWRIMSILMQAHESRDQTVVKNIYLPLAERLIEKYVDENKVEAEAEVKLYLMVLEKLGKTERRLAVIRGELGEKFRSKDERTNVELDCLLELERTDEVVEKLTELLHKTPDQWSFIRTYVNCQIQRYLRMREKEEKGEGGVEGSGDSVQSREGGKKRHDEGGSLQLTGEEGASESGRMVETSEDEKRTSGGGPSIQEFAGTSVIDPSLRPLVEARDLFEHLVAEEQRKVVEKSGKVHIYRGPFLARMELVRQLKDRKLLGELDLEIVLPVTMLMDYYKIFGTKNCVFDDLRMYLDTFRREDVNEFFSQLEVTVTADPVDFDCDDSHLKPNVDCLRRRISLMQLQRVWGRHQELKAEGKQQLLVHCQQWYENGLKLGRELPPTVNQHSDFYAVLAAHLQLELHHETGNLSHVWEAVFLLEHAKGSNPQLNLLLMKLYGYIGASECITDIFEKLFIKHMQTETLGYIPVRYMQSLGTFGYAEQLYRSGHRVYYGCSKEISEYIIQAYKNGMFQKIMEFVALRDRISHSLNFACVLVDLNLLELITLVHSVERGREFFGKEWFSGMPYSSSNLQAYCSRLVDSRDLRVLDDWSPSRSRLSDIEVKISFDLECLWLRVRVVLVQCLREAVLFTGARSGNKRPPPSPSDKSDPSGTSSEEGGASSLGQRIRDFSKCINLLDQHVGILILRQRKGTLLPIQSPPPCLGYTFLCESHGWILLAMLSVTEQIAAGATSVVEKLKEVLKMLETAKSRITGVPEDLRSSLMQYASSSNTQKDHLNPSPAPTHPYTLLMQSKMDLERYVMFVQVMSHLVLLCAVCVESLTPRSQADSKRRRKKKTAAGESPVTGELFNFVKELKVLLLAVSQQFHPLPSVEADQELADQLRQLYISKDAKHEPRFEHSVAANICRAVLESYNMSFRDCLQVVHAKVEFMNHIIAKLGGSEELPVDPRVML